MCCREEPNTEEHIYNVIDEEHAYEAVVKGTGKTVPHLPAVKAKDEIDLMPCPAYAPVTTTQGDGEVKTDAAYEMVSSL